MTHRVPPLPRHSHRPMAVRLLPVELVTIYLINYPAVPRLPLEPPLLLKTSQLRDQLQHLSLT